MNEINPSGLGAKRIAALRTVYDPEMPVSIYALGLIYEAAVDAAGHAYIRMTLTAKHGMFCNAMVGRTISSATLNESESALSRQLLQGETGGAPRAPNVMVKVRIGAVSESVLLEAQ
jgi:hypothetical protein